jgi:histidine triad (HIT) family protein
MIEREPFNLKAYVQGIGTRPCFICGLVEDDPAFFHHRVYEDDETIIFLSKYPTLPGYCLVCPKEHREDLARDISADEYLRLKEKVHILSCALKRVFDAERIYVLSLGSQQANSHLHFHVVPLPSGVPLEEQQYHALMAEHGVLQIPDDQMAELAQRIAEAYYSERTNRS